MKSFKEFMSEDGTRGIKSLGGDGGAQNQYGRWGQEPVHMGVHRIEDPNVLQRLNAHVGLVNTREYIDPRSALEHVQNALMRLGYHFDYNINELPNEQNVYPLSRFGGRQGFIDMDAEVKEDDGIEATGEKLVLNVEFIQDPDTSRYEVLAQIVPADLFDEEEIQPEAIRPNRASVPSTTGDRDGINIGEAVSISMGQEKGQGTFEVQFDFRGGPTRKQAQAFSLAAQKKLAGAQFTPNRKGTSEKVVVTVKASSPRDAQVKARKVLDNVKESIDEAANPKVGQTIAIKGTSGGFAFSKVRNVRGNSVQLENGDTLRQRDLLLVSDLGKGDDDRAILMRKNAAFVDLSIEEVASQIADDVMYEQSLASKAKLSNKALSDKIAKIRREDPDITQKAAAGKAVGILAPKAAKRLFTQNMDEGANVFPGKVSSDKGKFIVKVNFTRSDFRTGFTSDFQNVARKARWQVFSNPTRKAITVTLSAANPQDAQSQVSKVVSQARRMREETVSEAIALSRTFAFPTADGRDRIAKLLGLANAERISTSDKGKGKFKFVVSGSIKRAQIDRIMNTVQRVRGKVVGEQVNEDVSRTFVFPTADARDRMERLFALASREIVTTSDKGKGKFKFAVSGVLKGVQLDRIMNSVKQLRGKLGENSTYDIANNAVRKAIQERTERLHELDPFRTNQLKVARDTLKMSPVFQKVMGGPSKKEAIKILLDKGTSADKKLAKKAMNEAVLSELKLEVGDRVQFTDRGFRRKGKIIQLTANKGAIVKVGSQTFLTTLKELKPLSEAKDENEKELERTRKDGKLAGAFSEATNLFTVVAIKNNKVVGQIANVEKREIKTATKVLKRDHPGAKVSVENKSGRVVSVESMMASGFKEQLSKRKKKAPTASVGY